MVPYRAGHNAVCRKNCCEKQRKMNNIAALSDQVLTSSYGLILSGCGGHQYLPITSISANNSDVKPKSVAMAGGEYPHQRQAALPHLRRQAVLWGAT